MKDLFFRGEINDSIIQEVFWIYPAELLCFSVNYIWEDPSGLLFIAPVPLLAFPVVELHQFATWFMKDQTIVVIAVYYNKFVFAISEVAAYYMNKKLNKITCTEEWQQNEQHNLNYTDNIAVIALFNPYLSVDLCFDSWIVCGCEAAERRRNLMQPTALRKRYASSDV